MFSIDNSLTDLQVKDRKIFKIIYSMNSPSIATPEMSVEEARCYILFFSEGQNLSAYIGLYLPQTDRRYFYTYASNPFPFEAEADVDGEARTFAEDMGFLLDEINVSGMAVEDRNRWIEEQLIFGYKKPEGTAEEKEEKAEEKKTEKETAEPEQAEVPETVPLEQLEPVAPAPAPQPETGPVAQQYQPVQPPVQPAFTMPPAAPQEVAPAQPQAQPAYSPQAAPQQYQPVQPPVAPAYTPAPAPPEKPLSPPELEVPEEPQKKKPEPRTATRKKTTVAARSAPPSPESETETEVPVEIERETPGRQPRSLMEAAIREGIVRPAKQKVPAHPRSATGVVSRDKEAMARLLASF